VWTASNITASKNQTGIDGVANSASSLTATAGNGTCLQAITLASAARYQSAFVKRISGSGTINMTMDNGTTWTAITVTSDWTPLEIPSQTLANPTVGFRIVTSGDAIAVDCVQNENGAFRTSPIITYGTSLTRAADNIYIDNTAFPLSLLTLTAVVQARLPSPSFSFPCAFAFVQTAAPTSNRVQIYHGAFGANYNSTYRVTAAGGGSVGGLTITGTISPLTVYKTGLAFQSGSHAAVVNGGTVATDSAASVLTALDRLYLSQANTGHINGHIQSFFYTARRMSDAELQTKTTL
jgi:hypothetical protein